MPHFRVDDALHSHPKAQRVGDEALGMWVRAGSYCMAYLTDGFVPDWWVKQQPKGMAKAKRLVDAELWHDGATKDGVSGFQFHEFVGPGRQDSKEKVEADREASRQRKEKSRRESRKESQGASRGESQRDTPVDNSATDAETGVKNVDTTGNTDAVHSAVHSTFSDENSLSESNVENAPTSATGSMSRRDSHRPSRRSPGYTQPNPTQPIEENYSPSEESSPWVEPVTGIEKGLTDAIEPSASRLVATLIPDTIPAAVRTSLRIQASQLMRADRLDADTVADALRRWLAKPDAGPGLLPSLAADVIRARTQNAPPASKVRGYAELAQQVRAEEQQTLTHTGPKEIR